MTVRHIPDGYHTMTPFVVAEGAAKLIDFIQQAFGAEEVERMAAPDGTVMHAVVRIGDSMLMLGESQGEWKPMQIGLCLYVTDVDAVFARALEAGGTVVKPVTNQFYGDRNGTLRDPWGNLWSVGTHIEDVSPEDMKKRMDAAMKQHG